MKVGHVAYLTSSGGTDRHAPTNPLCRCAAPLGIITCAGSTTRRAPPGRREWSSPRRCCHDAVPCVCMPRRRAGITSQAWTGGRGRAAERRPAAGRHVADRHHEWPLAAVRVAATAALGRPNNVCPTTSPAAACVQLGRWALTWHARGRGAAPSPSTPFEPRVPPAVFFGGGSFEAVEIGWRCSRRRWCQRCCDLAKAGPAPPSPFQHAVVRRAGGRMGGRGGPSCVRASCPLPYIPARAREPRELLVYEPGVRCCCEVGADPRPGEPFVAFACWQLAIQYTDRRATTGPGRAAAAHAHAHPLGGGGGGREAWRRGSALQSSRGEPSACPFCVAVDWEFPVPFSIHMFMKTPGLAFRRTRARRLWEGRRRRSGLACM